MKNLKGYAVLFLILVTAALAVVGYLHNLYLVAVFNDSLVIAVLRAIGVLIPPIGAFLGFL